MYPDEKYGIIPFPAADCIGVFASCFPGNQNENTKERIRIRSWLLMCIYKTISFWNCAAGEHYHVLSGLCHIPKSYSPFRLRKVILTDKDGVETTLLLDRKTGVKDGLYYRLYFQGALPEETGRAKLDAALRSDALIGLEQIDPAEISKEKPS